MIDQAFPYHFCFADFPPLIVTATVIHELESLDCGDVVPPGNNP